MSSSRPSHGTTTTARPPERRLSPSHSGSAEWQVPAYDSEIYHPRRSRYAVCLFVLNEADRIVRQLTRMQQIHHGLDVVIADGGSSDGSTQRKILEPLGVNTLLVKRGPGRLSAQMRMALAWCLERGYEGIVVMDGNNKDDPSALPQFAALLDQGYDHVQGSRFVPGGQAINTPRSRYWGLRLLHAPLLSCAARFRYTDTTNGFRGYSATLLRDPRVAPFRDIFSQYELHYYLAISAARLGFRVMETPVTRAYPKDGPTPTKIHGFRGNLKILGTLLAACTGRYNVPATELNTSITRRAA
jgi:glycosyltransferase involved in cell wall biosynthesis